MKTSTVINKQKQRLILCLFALFFALGVAGGPLATSAEAGVDSSASVITTR